MHLIKKTILTLITSLLISLLFTSCGSINKLLKADPAPPAGFIEHPEYLKEWRDHAPFHGIWFQDKETFDQIRGKFKTVYFAPVTTDFIEKQGWWSSLNTADYESYKKELSMLARYTKKSMEKAFRTDPKKAQKVVKSPQKDTIVYEIAIVEVIATKAHLNAIGSVLGAVVPGGGLVASTAKGSIAIEVKVYDGETNELMIAWADREQDPSTIFSLADFSCFDHAKESIDNWAEQLVTLHNSTTKDRVEDSSPFSFLPF